MTSPGTSGRRRRALRPVTDGLGLVMDLGVQRFGVLFGAVLVDEAKSDRKATMTRDDDGVTPLADEV